MRLVEKIQRIEWIEGKKYDLYSVLSPWIKFVFDLYRNILEILKNK
jgi:hypothetical protein